MEPFNYIRPESTMFQTPTSPLPFTNEIYPDQSVNSEKHKSGKASVLLPGFALCLPMLLLSGALLSIIFVYEVRPRTSLFGASLTSDEYIRSSYILVDFSATQITFLASFISTLGPLLAGCIMSLSSILLSQDLKQPQSPGHQTALPTPYQMTLLIGTIAASYHQLWKAVCYLASRKRKTSAPPILWYAAATFIMSILLGLSVTVADAVFHTVIDTVSFTLYSSADSNLLAYGQGLNAFCSEFNRLETNDGFPCTYPADTDFVDPNISAEQAEIVYLMSNSSTNLEIRHASVAGEDVDVAYLMPKPSVIGTKTDYRATTFGVSSQCRLIPAADCNITRWGTPNPLYTNFNCSSNFWGTLGMSPNITEIDEMRQPSPYIPFLAIKPQSNLQYSFFSDYSLESVYNPAGLDDSGYPDPNIQPLSDAQLANRIYMAIAWRTPFNAIINGVDNELGTSDLTGHFNDSGYVDLFLRCELQAHDVDYTWFNQSLSAISTTSVSNGTLLNMWQGATSYGSSISGGGHILQNMNAQAVVAGDTISAYEAKFGALLSEQILSTIGGYSSPRTALQQQSRQTLLLAKIPKASLGVLVGCSLLYPVVGLIFLVKAYRVSREHNGMVNLLSYWGLASAAWNENSHSRRSALITAQAIEDGDRAEKMRVYIDRSSKGEYRFAPWTHGYDQDTGIAR